LVEKFAKPKPKASFFKDYLPYLSAFLSAIISYGVSIYTYTQKEKASIDSAMETLAKVVSESPHSANCQGQFDLAVRTQTMKVSAFGEQALAGVKKYLGSDEESVRCSGVLAAEQMYRDATIEHTKLTKEILGYFETGGSRLQRSVLEWAGKIDSEMPESGRRQAFNMINNRFGSEAQYCGKQDDDVAMETTNLLQIWSLSESKKLLDGMAKNCTNPDVRQQAQQVNNNIN
jgi:hypothetical protein